MEKYNGSSLYKNLKNFEIPKIKNLYVKETKPFEKD